MVYKTYLDKKMSFLGVVGDTKSKPLPYQPGTPIKVNNFLDLTWKITDIKLVLSEAMKLKKCQKVIKGFALQMISL